jgi:hypothetical protein
MPGNLQEITAAGTVQDFHLVPYYPELNNNSGTITRNKYAKIFAKKGKLLINTVEVGSIYYFWCFMNIFN